jgi:outer membrane protein assembly factor BamB
LNSSSPSPDGLVAFNTESCTLVVVNERTGRVIWQEWLGDPLMSQPAIDKGVLYIAHPAATGRALKAAEFHLRPASPGGSHRLLAADLRTGRHIWEQEISGDVITAIGWPVDSAPIWLRLVKNGVLRHIAGAPVGRGFSSQLK